jgi:predicted O-methyltransferase YrrM
MGGEGHLELIFRLVLAKRYRSVLETGVAYGWSSLTLLLALEILDAGELVSVDMPYAKRSNEPWVGVAVPPSLRHRWTLVRLPDRDGLPRALRRLDGGIDLFHYDSDKTATGRTYAYRRVWPAISPGGCLVSDDIEDNLAFRDFATQKGAPFWVLEKKQANFVGVMRKPER